MTRDGRSWYQVLQVDPAAEPEVIEVAYHRLARKYHPDVYNEADAHERMVEINGAYRVLRDQRSRAEYDDLGFPSFAETRCSESTDAPEQDDIFNDIIECKSCHRINFRANGRCAWCRTQLTQ